MQYERILNSLKRGGVAPVYLLYGEEEYLQEKIINAFKETILTPEMAAFNCDVVEGEKYTPAQLVDLSNTLPAFAEKRLVIVKDFPLLQARNSKEEAEEEEAEAIGAASQTPGSKSSSNENGLSVQNGRQGEHEQNGKNRRNGKSDKNQEEAKVLLQYLEKPSPSTCLVFWQKGKVKKNTKLYKAIAAAGQALEIGQLKGANLSNWLLSEAKKRGKRLERPALEYMIINCGNQLRQLYNELEKVAIYCADAGAITLDAVRQVVTISKEGNMFNFVDSIGLGKREAALQELRSLLANGELPVMIIAMIARQFRLLLQVKEALQKGWTEKQMVAELNLHPFVVSKMARQARNFSIERLERNLELVLEADVGMKTGLRTDLALEKLVFDLIPAP